MDDLKKQLAQVAKHQFWILSAVVLIASCVGFYLTSSSLSQQITSRISLIKGKQAEVQTVSGKVLTHPNETSHKKMEEMLANMRADVQRAWAAQYELQVELMKWPNEAFDKPETADIFRGLRPVEEFVDHPIKELKGDLAKITESDRRVYRDYIGPVFKDIPKKIGTEWKAELGTASATSSYGGQMGGPSGGPSGGYPGSSSAAKPEPTDVVVWSQTSQQELMNQMVPWYSPNAAPSILDIYYTQENIWLLTNIMQIIKNTNGDAKENFQATIKEIEWIRMGAFADRDAGSLFAGGGTAAGGGGGGYGAGGPPSGYSGGQGQGMPPGGYGGGGGAGGRGSMGMPTVSRVAPDPADDRYISFAPNSYFQLRKGRDLRESIRNVTAANAVDAIAKRVPIRMRVKMDSSKVHKLVTECGNAPFMLEVYQVRLNTAAAALGSAGSASGGGDRPTANAGGGGAASGSSMEGAGVGGGYPGTRTAEEVDPLAEIPVEVYGLIYLYNPVNLKALGMLGMDAKGKAPAGTPPAAAQSGATNAANGGANAAANSAATNPAATNPAPAAPPASPDAASSAGGNPPPSGTDQQPAGGTTEPSGAATPAKPDDGSGSASSEGAAASPPSGTAAPSDGVAGQ